MMKKEFHRSLGLELSGSKNDKSFLSVLDHHPKTHRLILVDVERLHDEELSRSNDEHLIARVKAFLEESSNFSGLAVNGPTSLPPYFEAVLNGKTKNFKRDPQVVWLEKTYKALALKSKPFEPYLQRPIEVFLRYICREKFQISDALGANAAPLTARYQYLKNYLPSPSVEVYARGTLSRIILSLGLKKQYLRDYSDAEAGAATREMFLDDLTRKLPQMFLYDKDLETLILNTSAFHSFLAALNLQLMVSGQCEKAPRTFPKEAIWIPLPLKNLNWEKIF